MEYVEELRVITSPDAPHARRREEDGARSARGNVLADVGLRPSRSRSATARSSPAASSTSSTSSCTWPCAGSPAARSTTSRRRSSRATRSSRGCHDAVRDHSGVAAWNAKQQSIRRCRIAESSRTASMRRCRGLRRLDLVAIAHPSASARSRRARSTRAIVPPSGKSASVGSRRRCLKNSRWRGSSSRRRPSRRRP